MFTYQYTQPEEYHFSLDSIHFAEFLAERLQNRKHLESSRVLDLCAGCGVIGLELSWYRRELKKIDFVEIQEIYTEYFQKNVVTVNRPELELNWHLINYDHLLNEEWREKYDLVISNPPYFLADKGILSPSQFKNRCRFYLDSTFKNFILAMANTLSIGGEAYFLLRPLHHHGKDMFAEVQHILKDTTIKASIISTLRGTDIVLLQKFN